MLHKVTMVRVDILFGKKNRMKKNVHTTRGTHEVGYGFIYVTPIFLIESVSLLTRHNIDTFRYIQFFSLQIITYVDKSMSCLCMF